MRLSAICLANNRILFTAFQRSRFNIAMEFDEVLPDDTLQILHEFLEQKKARVQKHNENNFSINYEENWQLSQFWYDETTKDILSNACYKVMESSIHDKSDFKIALLSCPSLYCSVNHFLPKVYLFEYDKRFASLTKNFIFYDYNNWSSNSLTDYEKCFDMIIADPPFLSEECIEKISKIIVKLAKSNAKIIVCSGVVTKCWMKTYLNLELCEYTPSHQRNLGNEFASYSNFNLDEIVKEVYNK